MRKFIILLIIIIIVLFALIINNRQHNELPENIKKEDPINHDILINNTRLNSIVNPVINDSELIRSENITGNIYNKTGGMSGNVCGRYSGIENKTGGYTGKDTFREHKSKKNKIRFSNIKQVRVFNNDSFTDLTRKLDES